MLGLGVRISDCTAIVDEQHPLDTTGIPDHGRAWIKDSYLLLEVQQYPGYNLAQLFLSSYGNNIYISQLYISSGGYQTELLRITIPSEYQTSSWKDRIYWVVGASHYTPFHPYAYEVFRSKIKITSGDPDPHLRVRR